MTPEEAKELGKKAAEWVASPEGQKAMRESHERAMEATKRLWENSKVDWRDLHRPIRSS